MSSKVLLERLRTLNSKFNIFTSIRPESLLVGEKTLTAAIKDNIATKEEPTTCSSRVLRDYVSPFDATVVDLLKDDVLIVGKTNMDEFGMGSGTTNSIFGPTLNPLFPNEKRISGGSSGGSAAAVASGAVDFALGTDTGGSVRLPAAYTGVYGFKPTYGRISRWGVIAYAQSLDTVGILSKDLAVLSKVYEKLDRHDPKDPTSLLPETRSQIDDSLTRILKRKTLRIGIPKELILNDLSDDVLRAWKDLAKKLADMVEIVAISIPTLKYALPIYYTIAPAEASSNLARFDGIRYGFRSDNDKNNYGKTRTLGFNEVVQNRIILGNYNLNADSYRNHFLKATILRSKIIEEFNDIFKIKRVNLEKKNDINGIDFILSPTSMTVAPTLEKFEKQSSTEIYTNDCLTVPASLAGLPAISIPYNINDTVVGLQIMGQYGDDKRVLEAARLISQL